MYCVLMFVSHAASQLLNMCTTIIILFLVTLRVFTTTNNYNSISVMAVEAYRDTYCYMPLR